MHCEARVVRNLLPPVTAHSTHSLSRRPHVCSDELAPGGPRVPRAAGAPRPRHAFRGVRVNDEFHSMNNGLSNFPESARTQAGVGPQLAPVRVPAWDLEMQIPADALALAMQVYTTLRGFSWQLRLAPFSFEALLAAVIADDSSGLRDELHICLLRALAWLDSKPVRAARRLDFASLDATTWPDYLWDYLRFLRCFDWWRTHVISRPPEQPSVDPATGQPPANPAERAPPSAGPMPAAEEAGGREAWLAYVRRLNTMNVTPDELLMREYSDLEVTERFALLNLLCDVLLEQPQVKEEIERRMTYNEHWHTGAGGEGGAGAVLSPERKAKQLSGEVSPDFHGCVLCTVADGGLLRCDACNCPYHLRCLGLRVAPAGAWQCPECRLGGRGEAAGVRIPLAAMQPGRISLYLLMGSVLRMPHPGQRIVPQDEDMADCGLEWLRGDAAMQAMSVAKRKSAPDGAHLSAIDLLADVCSSGAAGEVLEGEAAPHAERVPTPDCTPWSYINQYRCVAAHSSKLPDLRAGGSISRIVV